jgi:hypothetical protein
MDRRSGWRARICALRVTVARVGGHGAEAEGKRRAILTLLHGFTPVRLAQGSRHRFTSRRRASARGADWGISPEAPPSYRRGPLEAASGGGGGRRGP